MLHLFLGPFAVDVTFHWNLICRVHLVQEERLENPV